MKYVIIGLALAASLYIMTGYAFTKGYEQGYVEGRDRALIKQGTTAEQCFLWWFGPNKKQFEHEMKQFCKRSGT
jgi:flagellar biosynthesis protein FliP